MNQNYTEIYEKGLNPYAFASEYGLSFGTRDIHQDAEIAGIPQYQSSGETNAPDSLEKRTS